MNIEQLGKGLIHLGLALMSLVLLGVGLCTIYLIGLFMSWW